MLKKDANNQLLINQLTGVAVLYGNHDYPKLLQQLLASYMACPTKEWQHACPQAVPTKGSPKVVNNVHLKNAANTGDVQLTLTTYLNDQGQVCPKLTGQAHGSFACLQDAPIDIQFVRRLYSGLPLAPDESFEIFSGDAWYDKWAVRVVMGAAIDRMQLQL